MNPKDCSKMALPHGNYCEISTSKTSKIASDFCVLFFIVRDFLPSKSVLS